MDGRMDVELRIRGRTEITLHLLKWHLSLLLLLLLRLKCHMPILQKLAFLPPGAVEVEVATVVVVDLILIAVVRHTEAVSVEEDEVHLLLLCHPNIIWHL